MLLAEHKNLFQQTAAIICTTEVTLLDKRRLELLLKIKRYNNIEI